MGQSHVKNMPVPVARKVLMYDKKNELGIVTSDIGSRQCCPVADSRQRPAVKGEPSLQLNLVYYVKQRGIDGSKLDVNRHTTCLVYMFRHRHWRFLRPYLTFDI